MEDKIFSSLTADSELRIILEMIENKDYKSCKRAIEKKLPKLKSEGDKLNFKIAKMLLLFKSKKYDESNSLKLEIKTTLMTTIKNEEITKFFKNSLKDMGDDATLSEIYKNSLKSKNFSEISKEEQNSIIKELTYYFEFQEIYKIINQLEKNNNRDKHFITLIKYEIIYILLQSKKLPSVILNKTLKDLTSIKELEDNKGYIDLVIKYYRLGQDTKGLKKFLEENQLKFTNAPVKDLLVDIYYKDNEILKAINYAISEIYSNPEKCLYVYYERLVNLVFYQLKKNQFEFSKINNEILVGVNDKLEELSYYEAKEGDDYQNLIRIVGLFKSLSRNDPKTYFYSTKGSKLSLILIYHFLIINSKISDEIIKLIKDQITDILVNNVVSKQSIFFEISDYFIYLDTQSRNEVFNLVTKSLDQNNDENLIFTLKLEKLFGIFSNEFTENYAKTNDIKLLSDKIKSIYNEYLRISNKTEKIEKGERVLGDDLVIIINEYVFEFIYYVMKHHNTFLFSNEIQELIFNVFLINEASHSKSIYNYDITIYLIKICSLINLNAKVLDKIKYMNLKGPQFETVSYLILNSSLYESSGKMTDFLIKSYERWEKENKRGIRYTVWKMFQSLNFWNSEELLQFDKECDRTYFSHFINFLDLQLNYLDKFEKIDSDEREKSSSEILDLLIKTYNKLTSSNLYKNQDIVISLHKYKNQEFFNGDHGILLKNVNFNVENYKFSIDALGKDNIIYSNKPGFKNNYFENQEVDVFGCFSNVNFISLRYLSSILSFSLKNKEVFNKFYQTYLIKLKESYNLTERNKTHILSLSNYEFFEKFDEVQSSLFKFYSDCLTDLSKNLSDSLKSIENSGSLLKLNLLALVELFSSLTKKYNFIQKKFASDKISIFFTYFFNNLVSVIEAILSLIDSNKKTLQNLAVEAKGVIVKNFKETLLNFIDEMIQSSDKFNEIDESLNGNFVGNHSEVKKTIIDEGKEFLKELKEILRRKREFLKSLI